MDTRLGKILRTIAAGLICAVALASAPSHAVVIIVKDPTLPVSNIPALTGFSTSGDEMVGMSVTATFTNQTSETLFWAATGNPGQGGVFSTKWSLVETGDTFGGDWVFTFEVDDLQLQSLVLNGNTGFTVFDTTDPGPGTPGSASGMDFAFVTGFTGNATATYSDIVSVGANAAVGDLYHVLTINFGQGGPRTAFTFEQDTDNDARLRAPEPGSLALLGLALAGLGFARRRASR